MLPSSPLHMCILLTTAPFELEAGGIYTISLSSSFCGSVVEHVPEMRATAFAADLYARHSMTKVLFQVNMLAIHWLSETRPASARIKFRS